MLNTIQRAVLLFSVSFVLIACSELPTKEEVAHEGKPNCHIIYDAGSSGTRLYIYTKDKGDDKWTPHRGPTTGKEYSLATPIINSEGKTAEEVVGKVVSLLEEIKKDGPIDKDTGEKEWETFDWSNKENCASVKSAKVYATAGMRLAEQSDPDGSRDLWKRLWQKLADKYGNDVVETRTITGYEEGLYAWLAVKGTGKDTDFGIVEMGGASSQITFPCADGDQRCTPDNNDAVKKIRLDGEPGPLSLYSYSFLGLGQDKAPKIFGVRPECEFGVAKQEPNWKRSHCEQQIEITNNENQIRDPYNYHNGRRDTYVRVPDHQKEPRKWYLTGAFHYYDSNNVNQCCVKGNEKHKGCKYEKENSCFRALYLTKYLKELKVPATSPKKDVSWTLGAVICEHTDCLKDDRKLACRWVADKRCSQPDMATAGEASGPQVGLKY